MKREFFTAGTCVFTFLNNQITNWEGLKNEDLTVYDGRVKLMSVKELLEQDLTPGFKIALQRQNLSPDQKILVNYIFQIGDEPFLDAKSEDKEVVDFFTEMNDRMFHAQHFNFMYLPMIEGVLKEMSDQTIWELEDDQRIFQYTMMYYMGILKQEYPFGQTEPTFLFEGLPGKDEAKLMVIYAAK